MSTSPRHGQAGCPCEDCLTARIRLSVERAADGRDMSALRSRLDGVRVRIATPAVPLRSVS